MTRTFLAIDLSDEARATLRRTLRRVGAALPGVRLSDAADLHLTLAFLGEIDDETLAAVVRLTEEAALQTSPFTLALGRLGIFGPPYAPRVLWAGVDGDLHRLSAFQRRLTESLEQIGFPRESRPYAPHLTLARINHPLAAASLAQLTTLLAEAPAHPVRWKVADVRVMRSDLSAKGARYSALTVAPFSKPHT